MKRIKTKNIDPEKTFTKSEYARLIGVTPAAVQKMIDRGAVVIVEVKGAQLIHL